MSPDGPRQRASHSDAEQQVLAILRALEVHPLDQETGRPATFDLDCLQRHGRLFFQEDLVDWQGAVEGLLGHGHLRRQGAGFHLTHRSRDAAEGFRKRFTGNRFGRLQIRCEASEVYGELSRRVFLGEHRPFSLLDREQLDLVLEFLEAKPHHQILDLGCGIGTVTEALQRVTGARFLGLDLAEPAISRALERIQGEGLAEPCLEFFCVDLESLSLNPGGFQERPRETHLDRPWDRLIAIDVLYFLQDPAETLGHFLQTAKPGARMVLAASDVADDADRVPTGTETRLGKILTALNLPFQAHDVRHLEEGIWRRQDEAARDLLPTFQEEGSEDLGRLALQEADRCLPWIDAGRARRFLYRVELP